MAAKKAKLSTIVVEELRKRSSRGLKLAKKTMLKERIECPKLREALEHYVKNWDDFTHPGLLSLGCEAVGGHPDSALRVQAAAAMLAAAFDIHDDIIDESQQKHGVPTVYGKYGKDIALLLGNAFMIKGFTFFLASVEQSGKKRSQIVEALQKSLFELGNAHASELNLRGRVDAASEEYMRVAETKAANIEADMRIGAIVGGGSDKEVEALARYGRILGTLATLREEFIDVYEIEELNQRIRVGYLPIPVLYAMQDEKGKGALNSLFANQDLTKYDADNIVELVFKARSVAKLCDSMKSLVSEAVHLASEAKHQVSRTVLTHLACSTLEDLWDSRSKRSAPLPELH